MTAALAPADVDARSRTTADRLSNGARLALAALAVVVTAWCAAGIPTRATYGAQLTADEPQYVLSAISVAEDHSTASTR